MAVAGEASGGRLRNSLFPSIVERGSQRRGAVTGAPVVGRGEAQPLTASTDAKQSRPEGKRPHLSYAPTKMSEFPKFSVTAVTLLMSARTMTYPTRKKEGLDLPKPSISVCVTGNNYPIA